MKLLLRLEKGEQVKYISHLDMQRLFQRAMRRAKLPCAYSQGFNPHMLVSFAGALPVGVCSKAEYAEVVLEKFVHPEDVKRLLNEVLPEGVKILASKEIENGAPAVAAISALAEYSFRLENGGDFKEKLDGVMKQAEIFIEKKTKKGMATVNVRHMIHSISQQGDKIYATLSCGNNENLRGDKFREILESFGVETAGVLREKLFVLDGNELKEPLECAQ